MRSFGYLYLATVREFTRDRTALFWTIAFPVMFTLIFGVIFSGMGSISFDIGLVNEDGASSTRLVDSFKQIDAFKIKEGTRADELQALKDGKRSAVIIIPAGTGQALAQPATQTGGALLDVYYDPANQNTSQIVLNIVDKVVAGMNEGITGIPPALTIQTESVRANKLRDIDYLLPGVLAMSLMQLGLFGTAGPLVSLREKQVLRRMGATPLSKTTLLASQVTFRLTTALVQTVILVAVGAAAFNVHIVTANIPAILGVVLLGATVFITFGYFISGLAKTEEAVQGLISLPNFIFMFLSGIFFPIEVMPGWIRPAVDVIPLTYLGDALRATMIEAGSTFSMARNLGVLAAWLVACAVLAVRFFRWEPQA
jgi:ABC-2 type transport system permease protein